MPLPLSDDTMNANDYVAQNWPNGLPVNRPTMPTNDRQQPSMVQRITDKLLGTNGQERYQLWPERLVRDALSAPHDVLNSQTPMTSEDMIKPAMDISALAGTGGLAGAEAGAAMGAGPFLRPALKYEGKIYKAPVKDASNPLFMGAEHSDAIPQSLLPEFTRQAMNGEDISNFNFGFINHKGQFLDREKALDYGIKEGLLSPHDAKFGALTSTMGEMSVKPTVNDIKDFIPAIKDKDTNKIYSGDANSTHPSLQYQEGKFLNNKTDGFVDKNGNFLTRKEFRNKFGLDESMDLNDVKAGKYLPSTMMADSSKPALAVDTLRGHLSENVPPKPGTAKIPEGSVRLYHQTNPDFMPDIAENGIQLSKARGIEGPRAVYADTKGFYGKPGEIPTVEFHVPKERWDAPFVRTDSELDKGMVSPDNIVAIHMPWHSTARYIENDPKVLKNVLSGDHDNLISEKNYGTAIKYIKSKYQNKEMDK